MDKIILSFILLDFRCNCLPSYSGTSGISQYSHCIFYPLAQSENFILGFKYQVEAPRKPSKYKTNTRKTSENNRSMNCDRTPKRRGTRLLRCLFHIRLQQRVEINLKAKKKNSDNAKIKQWVLVGWVMWCYILQTRECGFRQVQTCAPSNAPSITNTHTYIKIKIKPNDFRR